MKTNTKTYSISSKEIQIEINGRLIRHVDNKRSIALEMNFDCNNECTATLNYKDFKYDIHDDLHGFYIKNRDRVKNKIQLVIKPRNEDNVLFIANFKINKNITNFLKEYYELLFSGLREQLVYEHIIKSKETIEFIGDEITCYDNFLDKKVVKTLKKLVKSGNKI